MSWWGFLNFPGRYRTGCSLCQQGQSIKWVEIWGGEAGSRGNCVGEGTTNTGHCTLIAAWGCGEAELWLCSQPSFQERDKQGGGGRQGNRLHLNCQSQSCLVRLTPSFLLPGQPWLIPMRLRYRSFTTGVKKTVRWTTVGAPGFHPLSLFSISFFRFQVGWRALLQRPQQGRESPPQDSKE